MGGGKKGGVGVGGGVRRASFLHPLYQTAELTVQEHKLQDPNTENVLILIILIIK